MTLKKSLHPISVILIIFAVWLTGIYFFQEKSLPLIISSAAVYLSAVVWQYIIRNSKSREDIIMTCSLVLTVPPMQLLSSFTEKGLLVDILFVLINAGLSIFFILSIMKETSQARKRRSETSCIGNL